MPVTPTELTVRNGAQTDFLLLCDKIADRCVLCLPQLLCRGVSCRIGLAHFHERGGAQKTAYNIVAKRCLCMVHNKSSYCFGPSISAPFSCG